MIRVRTIALVLASSGACERPAPAPQPASAPPQAAASPHPATAARAAPDPGHAQLPTAGALHYYETVVGGGEPEAALPMIVAIHGLGDTPQNFSHLFDAFTEPARVILPQGIEQTEGGGWSWFAVRARSPDVAGLAVGISNSADSIAEAVAQLIRKRPTVGKPIVTGFSQGGMLTFALAVEHPEVFGAAIPVGGWLPPPLWPPAKPVHGPSIHALHGVEDNAVPFEPTRVAVEHLKSLGMSVELTAYAGTRHVLSPEITRDLYDRSIDAVRQARAEAEGQ